jgi:flagellar motor switch protein FliG
MSLGEEEASEVFKHLAPKEVQKLGETIAKLKVVPRDAWRRCWTASRRWPEQSMLVADTDEYVAVLRKALGDDKANLLIDRILQGSDVSGIESLKWMDPGSVAELLRNEHPQIVAAILAHLEFDQVGRRAQAAWSERQRNEVLIRIATLDGIQPQALKDLNEVMSKVLAGGDRMKKSSLGGVKAAAEIINMMGSSVETSALDYIREADGELAQKIMDNMFTFDDLDKLDDKGIQALLKEVQSESLVIALKGATPGPAREGLPQHVHPRRRDAARGPGVARPGAAVRGRGRAEGNARRRSCAAWSTKARSCWPLPHGRTPLATMPGPPSEAPPAAPPTAVMLARQVVRSEIAMRQDCITQVAHDAVSALILSARHLRLRLNPADLPLVEAGCADLLRARTVLLQGDATIEPGGCVLESDLGQVDARIETRWAHAAAVLGSGQDWAPVADVEEPAE